MRGPKSGERVGGVCPEDVLFAVRRDKSVSTDMRMDWMVGGRSVRNAEKCAGGYLRARKQSIERCIDELDRRQTYLLPSPEIGCSGPKRRDHGHLARPLI